MRSMYGAKKGEKVGKIISPIGLECTLCKQAFLITNTKRIECGDEDTYNMLWPKVCVSPWEMVKLIHPDLFHDMCVHDGENLPLCSELAATVDDGWCFDNQAMSNNRNKKYEQEICPTEVAWEMIQYNMKVDLAQFSVTFQCPIAAAKQCFAHLGLMKPLFEEQYDILFGEGEFERRNAIANRPERVRAKQTARKRQYADMSHDEESE